MSPSKISHAAEAPAIGWFRRDLRLSDHPALAAAWKTGRPVCALYVLDEDVRRPWAMGAAARWRLHQSLTALAATIEKRGGSLVLRRGDAVQEVVRLAAELKAAAVCWLRAFDPHGVAADDQLRNQLRRREVETHCLDPDSLCVPTTIAPKSGGYFKVFTPFWRACQAHGFTAPIAAPDGRWPRIPHPPQSDSLVDWELTPTRPNWAKGFEPGLCQGEAAAKATLDGFLSDALQAYPKDRNRPDREGTSRLSTYLAFGELSARAVAAEIDLRAHADPRLRTAADKFLAELGWREFSRHLLLHAPTMPDAPLRPQFNRVQWRKDHDGLEAWQRGRTGFPIVDAGMRQLWETGWMHNRVRMIVGSFLVKDLLIDWREGERWFWDTLLDADLANNAMNWQWVAGCGTDSAPYFRIFNPIRQGQEWDPDGAYVRRWVPELAGLPDASIHAPTKAAILDHTDARKRALAAYATAVA